jgi:hypothetical protein
MKVKLRATDIEVVMTMNLEETEIIREAIGRAPYSTKLSVVLQALEAIAFKARALVVE